ncbi:MAG: response regulator [Alphaproteobacteria bacterium]
MRVLIVDDSIEIREIIAAYLAAAGYADPIRAANAEEALALLGVGWSGSEGAEMPLDPVDVVLMDIIMPGMDGIEACARIKRHPPLAETPVLMVSSRDDTTSLQQAFLAGASDYIRKPIERVELLARIRSALRLRAELERRRAQEDALRAETERLRRSVSQAAIDPASGLLSLSVAGGFLESLLNAGREAAVLVADIDDRVTSSGVMRAEDVEMVSRALYDVVAREPGQLGDVLAAGAAVGRVALVLADRTVVEAAAFAERLRIGIERARIPQPNARSGLLTVSIGLADCAAGTVGANDVFERATRALLSASARGGNRVETAVDGRTATALGTTPIRSHA